MKFKKIIGAFATLTAVTSPVVAVISCNGSKSESTEVGTIVYQHSDPFIAGIEAEMAKFSGTIGVHYSQAANALGDDSKALDAEQNLILKSPKVLSINPVSPASVQSYIDKAKAANLPLVLWNKEATEKTRKTVMGSYDKVVYVGTDPKSQGEIQAQELYDDIESGKVNSTMDINKDKTLGFNIIQGESGHQDAIARTTAFQAKIKELLQANPLYWKDSKTDTDPTDKTSANEVKVHNLGDDNMFYTDWTSDQGKSKSETLLKKAVGDRPEAIICNNDGLAVGVIQTLTDLKLNGKYPVYGVDATSDGKAKIKSGELFGTVLNDAVMQARLIMTIVKDFIDGKNISPTYTVKDGRVVSEATYTMNKDWKSFYVPSVAINMDNVDKY